MTPPLRIVAGSCLALLSGFAPGCGDASEIAPPRLVVLYVPCALRAPSLGPYDRDVAFTPNLKAFARASVVFRRHTTEVEESGPSYASILSGTQAYRHGIYRHPTMLADDLHLVAESFAEHGYETWFWSGQPMASAILNYGQGVPPERTVIPTKPGLPGQWIPGDAETLSANDPRFEKLLDALAADPKKRAFVQVEFTLTHEPYYQFCTKPMVLAFCREFPGRTGGLTYEEIDRFQGLYAEHRGNLEWDYAKTVEDLHLSAEERTKLARTMRIFYETAVWALDARFGQFVESIRKRHLLKESLIAFTADHGEVLDRENALFRWSHGCQLAPETLTVPWILYAPGRLKPRSYEPVTRSIDVFPTLAGLCGIEVPASYGIEGVDLSSALLGKSPAPELLARSHTTVMREKTFESFAQYGNFVKYFPRPDPQFMWVSVRSKDLVCKLRGFGDEKFGYELFDLAKDPGEEHDLFDAQNPAHAALARDLDAYKAKLVEGFKKFEGAQRLSEEEEEKRMKALGYVK